MPLNRPTIPGLCWNCSKADLAFAAILGAIGASILLTYL